MTQLFRETKRIDDLGRVQIPKWVRAKLDVDQGDTLGFIINDDDTVTLIKVVEESPKDDFKFSTQVSWNDLHDKSFQNALKNGDIIIKFTDFE
jgi:AbrB family looped-hinge helix DNA binding protein